DARGVRFAGRNAVVIMLRDRFIGPDGVAEEDRVHAESLSAAHPRASEGRRANVDAIVRVILGLDALGDLAWLAIFLQGPSERMVLHVAQPGQALEDVPEVEQGKRHGDGQSDIAGTTKTGRVDHEGEK